MAAGKGHEIAIKLFIKHGGDVNARDNDGRTPLDWAAGNGHDGAANLLIQHGAKVS